MVEERSKVTPTSRALPAVTVVTAVRNGEATLERTLRSVMRQTYPHLEHLVVDGASTDGTRGLLERYASRLRWVSEPDRGLYDAMNKGLELVADRERYVLFLNADDQFFADDSVEHVVRESHGEDLLYGRLERHDEALDYRDTIGRPVTSRDLLFGMKCHHQAIFCRRGVFDRMGGFDLQYRIAADYDWAVRAFLRADVSKRFVPVVVSVMSRGGLSDQRYLAAARERWRIVRRHYPLSDLARFSVYTGFGDYLRYFAQRGLKRLGLLNRVRGLRDRIHTSPALQKIVPNASWLLADRILRLSLGLVLGVWLARYLGPAAFGQLNFAIAFVTLFAALATLGLERLVVRELVNHPGQERSILGSAFGLKLLGGLAALALSVTAMSLLKPGDTLALALVAVFAAAAVVQAFDVIDLWYQSQTRARWAVMATGTGFALAAVLKIILIVVRAPLVAFAWAAFAETALSSLGLALIYQRREGRIAGWRWSGERARALIRDGWPLVLSSALIMIYLRIDQVMLGQMASPDELGAYSVAVKLVEVWYFVPTAVVAAAFPSIVEARRQGEALFYDRLQKLYGLMAVCAYAVAIPTTLLSGWLVRLLFGEPYARAGPMLAVLVWSLLFTNLGVARGSFLTTMNWNRAYLMTVGIGAAINVALNLILIPRLGGMGAVIASVVAYWVAAHGACYLYPPLVRTGNMLARAMVAPRL